MAMGVMGIPRFERFFRSVAELDVDKDDLKRFNGFVFDQIYDMLIRAEANAKANLRDTIEPWDLPITKGVQERIHEFEKLDDEMLVYYAVQIGLDPDRFIEDLAQHRYIPRIQEDLSSGARSGVNGTPTFFVNGVRYEGPTDVQPLIRALEHTASVSA